MAKSRDYWRRRFELLLDTELNKGSAYLEDLEKAYVQTNTEIEKDIARWFTRFASNNDISLSEAKRLLNSNELKEFMWTVEEYIEYGEKNALNPLWMKQLENASARVHISRLESLKLQLQQHVEKLYGSRLNETERVMKELYQSQYYHVAFEVQKGFQVGFTMKALDDATLSKVLSKPWTADNMTFSDRIWRDKQLLINTLHTELTQTITRGEAPDRLIKLISKKLNTSKNNAGRLVMTESAFFSSAAQKDAFNELDVEKFEIVATLDNKTSDICQSLDGKVFEMSDYEPGVTANPFHSWCRSTTVPFFNDNYGKRIARGKDGKVYYIPSNITYKEWEKRFVS